MEPPKVYNLKPTDAVTWRWLNQALHPTSRAQRDVAIRSLLAIGLKVTPFDDDDCADIDLRP